MTFRPGHWTTVLVFSGYVLLWRRGASDTQPVGRQGTYGRTKSVRLAVLRGAGVAACLARYAGAWPRGRQRAPERAGPWACCPLVAATTTSRLSGWARVSGGRWRCSSKEESA